MFPTDQHKAAAVAGLTIETVTTAEQQTAFADAVAGSFGMPRDLMAGFENPALLGARGLTCYVGWLDGRPVATSLLFETDRVAGVHVVGTVPEFRRRGIGAVMTQRCVDDGWANGCTVSALQSSSSGYAVYERLGFRRVTDIQGWTFAGA